MTTTAVQGATQSLLTSLGSGSGVDTASLVTSLVQAQFATRTARLTRQGETLSSQISGVSTIKSAISGFALALDNLAKSGTLSTQPRSSDAKVLTATALPGAKLATLASGIAVDRLATGQAAATAAVTLNGAAVTRNTVLGSGSFTLQLGTAVTATSGGTTSMTGFTPASGTGTRITFAMTDATVDTIAARINSEGAALGINAAVVTGADGSPYLTIKGATGAARAFTLSTTGDAALEQFRVGPSASTTLTAVAQNAQLKVDGIAVERAGNTIDDLVAGVKLELTGTGVASLGITRPTEGLTQAVNDVAETYNQVVALIAAQTDPATGTLGGDPAARSLLRSLRGLTLSALRPAGSDGPTTLAELGVRTEKNGTLSVNAGQLAATLAAKPDAVEAMFVSSTGSATGLPAVLKRLSDAAIAAQSGLGASTARYSREQQAIATQQAKIATESEAMTTRLTGQYAAMNARITAYRSTQTYLDNQIKMWTRSEG